MENGRVGGERTHTWHLPWQVAYGRLTSPVKGTIDLDLFVFQPDGRKILDPHKQKMLLQMMERELQHTLRVVVTTRGPDTELLVATPIELSGRGRPRVLYDITLALKMLDICIFKVCVLQYNASSNNLYDS